MLELADIIERTGRVDLGSFITLNGCDAPRLPAGVVVVSTSARSSH